MNGDLEFPKRLLFSGKQYDEKFKVLHIWVSQSERHSSGLLIHIFFWSVMPGLDTGSDMQTLIAVFSHVS